MGCEQGIDTEIFNKYDRSRCCCIPTTKYHDLNLYWFIGNRDTQENLYVQYGHMGFGIPDSNIYGFGPEGGRNADIFWGKYKGIITLDNHIFNQINNKNLTSNNFEIPIHKLTVKIDSHIYNIIKSWDEQNITRIYFNNLLYGLPGCTIYNNKHKVNCLTFIKFLIPSFQNKSLNYFEGILYEFDLFYSKHIS